jgi:hypothetical protein
MSKLTASATALQTAIPDANVVLPAAATLKALDLVAQGPTDRSPTPLKASGVVQWWFDARKLPSKRILPMVEQSNCTHIVVEHAQHRTFTTAKQKVVVVDASAQLKDLEPGAWVMTREEPLRRQAAALGHKAGLFIDVMDLEREFPYCIEVCERGDDFVVIDIEHATYIPYELLLAKTEGKPTKIFRNVPIKGLQGVVDDINQSLNAFATMEHGIGVVLRTEHAEVVENLSQRIEQRRDTRIQLVKARVEEVQHTGLGHRVCVDCTSMMSVEEGMIVGSTGWGGLFVCSETHYLPHMNLREFRVNAGAVHSYIWGPDDKRQVPQRDAGRCRGAVRRSARQFACRDGGPGQDRASADAEDPLQCLARQREPGNAGGHLVNERGQAGGDAQSGNACTRGSGPCLPKRIPAE